jgi:hypothetical protein
MDLNRPARCPVTAPGTRQTDVLMVEVQQQIVTVQRAPGVTKPLADRLQRRFEVHRRSPVNSGGNIDSIDRVGGRW